MLTEDLYTVHRGCEVELPGQRIESPGIPRPSPQVRPQTGPDPPRTHSVGQGQVGYHRRAREAYGRAGQSQDRGQLHGDPGRE